MTLLTRQSLLTLAPEATYNTAPATGYVAIEVLRDPDVAPFVAERVAAETVRPYWGADRVQLVNRRVTISLEVYLTGSGTAGTAPAWGPLMLAAGASETIVANTSVTYALVNAVSSSLTMRWHTGDGASGGIRHQVTGFRCSSFGIVANVGEFPRLRCEGVGIYSQPTALALPTVAYANQAVPFAITAANTPTVQINSVGNCMGSFEFTASNEIDPQDYAGCSQRIVVTGRSCEGSIEVMEKLLADQNIYSLAEGDTLVPITWTHSGGGAGNTSQVTIPNADILEPTLADRTGTRFINAPYSAIRTSAATSEFSLVFT